MIISAVWLRRQLLLSHDQELSQQPAEGGGDHYLHFRYFTFHLLYTAWGIVYYNGRMYFFVMQGSLYRVDDRKIFWRRMLERFSSWVGGKQNGEIHFKYPHPEDHWKETCLHGFADLIWPMSEWRYWNSLGCLAGTRVHEGKLFR